MPPFASGRPRRGWTIIELAIVVAVAIIATAVALPRIGFNRWTMDANARLVQNTVRQARELAITSNMNVVIEFDRKYQRIRYAKDSVQNNTFNPSERVINRRLAEGAQFLVPPGTTTGGAAFYAISGTFGFHWQSGVGSQPYVVARPNGSFGGDFVVYIGTQSTRSSELRAVEFTGATGRTRFWRWVNGGWSPAN